MYVISSSGGNDSVAMIQWAIEQKLPDVHVTFCDTGWSAPGWMVRIDKVHAYAEAHGMKTHIVKSIGMHDLVRTKRASQVTPSNSAPHTSKAYRS